MRKWILIIDVALAIILVFVLGWYLFGKYRPFDKEMVDEPVEQSVQVEEPEVEEPEEEIVEEPVNEITTIVFTGDVELSEYVQANYDANGVDGVVDEEVLALLKDATFTMINNEFCFSTRGTQAPDKQFTFRVDPKYGQLLVDMGVDVAGLANNHVLDFGKDALLDTFDTMDSYGIEYTGAGTSLDHAAGLVVKTDDLGRKYGFLAASHVIPVGSWDVVNSQPGTFTFYDETELLNRIEQYSKEVDYLFVMVHWGIERTIELKDYQVNDGHKFIDAGATAVIGMHSHCLQPVEMYNGHPIIYSLGNFIFNTNIASGGACRITVDKDNNLTTEIIPIVAQGAKTRLSTEQDSDYYSYIMSISETINIDEHGVISAR